MSLCTFFAYAMSLSLLQPCPMLPRAVTIGRLGVLICALDEQADRAAAAAAPTKADVVDATGAVVDAPAKPAPTAAAVHRLHNLAGRTWAKG